MKTIVLSGINLTSGGTLSIFKDCLDAFNCVAHEFNVIALVHDKNLFDKNYSNIKFMEFPKSKASWLNRIYYEYFFFKKLSKKLNPYLWFSLHDITPNVNAEIKAVYCHNASQFYKLRADEILLDKKFYLFNKFYKYLYKINIKKNNYVIVQQDWLRQEFKKLYGIDNLVVAHPKVENLPLNCEKTIEKTFIYPTLPRLFKNIELICEAVMRIDDDDLTIYITIDGTENLYAKRIVNKYANLRSIKFIGLQSRKEVYKYYEQVTGMIFPSKLESWGLPLTEFAATNKIIFASNLNFCKETLSNYQKAVYFDPYNPEELAIKLKRFINDGSWNHEDNKSRSIAEPFAQNWEALISILLEKKGSDINEGHKN